MTEDFSPKALVIVKRIFELLGDQIHKMAFTKKQKKIGKLKSAHAMSRDAAGRHGSGRVG